MPRAWSMPVTRGFVSDCFTFQKLLSCVSLTFKAYGATVVGAGVGLVIRQGFHLVSRSQTAFFSLVWAHQRKKSGLATRDYLWFLVTLLVSVTYLWYFSSTNQFSVEIFLAKLISNVFMTEIILTIVSLQASFPCQLTNNQNHTSGY